LGSGVTNLVLRGRLGTLGADEIDFPFSAVAGAKRAIVVDISQVDFITSLGVRLLLNGAKAVEKNGGHLVLLSPHENVHSVLPLPGRDHFTPVIFHRPAAVAAVMGSAHY